MLRKLAIAVALLVAVPLIGIPCWIALHRDDLPSPYDDDLLRARATVIPHEKNAFNELVVAGALIREIDDAEWFERLNAIREGGDIDSVWLDEVLSDTASAREALRRALDPPDMQVPHTRIDDSDDGSPFIGLGLLIRIAGAHAHGLARADRADDALEEAFLGMLLGSKLSRADGTHLLPMMFALSFQAMSLQDMTAIMRETTLDARHSRELVTRLEAARWSRVDWRSMWGREYGREKTFIVEMLRSIEDQRIADRASARESVLSRLIPDDYLWQPNRSISLFADAYRARQRWAGLSCADVFDRQPDVELTPFRKLRALLEPNAIGTLLMGPEGVTPNLLRFELKRCHLETRISLLQTFIASKAYHSDHGHLPQQLSDLVPSYLDAVPRESFLGEELRYDSARALAYSPGDDFTDSRGGDTPDPHDASEPAISLTF